MTQASTFDKRKLIVRWMSADCREALRRLPEYRVSAAHIDQLPLGSILVRAFVASDAVVSVMTVLQTGVFDDVQLADTQRKRTPAGRAIAVRWLGYRPRRASYYDIHKPVEASFILMPGDPGFDLADAFATRCEVLAHFGVTQADPILLCRALDEHMHS